MDGNDNFKQISKELQDHTAMAAAERSVIRRELSESSDPQAFIEDAYESLAGKINGFTEKGITGALANPQSTRFELSQIREAARRLGTILAVAEEDRIANRES